MSYAIVRNDKLTIDDAKSSFIHNDRRSKGHSNKDIDPTRTLLNYYLKKNNQTYIREFDRLRKENNLQGQSIIHYLFIITIFFSYIHSSNFIFC